MLQRSQGNKVATRKRDGYRKNRKIIKQSKEEKIRKPSKATLVIKSLRDERT
jgi:hypothetical protein